jgi:hypothetical protein
VAWFRFSKAKIFAVDVPSGLSSAAEVFDAVHPIVVSRPILDTTPRYPNVILIVLPQLNGMQACRSHISSILLPGRTP